MSRVAASVPKGQTASWTSNEGQSKAIQTGSNHCQDAHPITTRTRVLSELGCASYTCPMSTRMRVLRAPGRASHKLQDVRPTSSRTRVPRAAGHTSYEQQDTRPTGTRTHILPALGRASFILRTRAPSLHRMCVLLPDTNEKDSVLTHAATSAME